MRQEEVYVFRDGRGLRHFGVALLAAALLTLACGAASAQAAKAPVFNFGVAGAQGGQLGSVRGIAVNRSGIGGVPPGTIYLAEFGNASTGNNRISSFAPNDNGTPSLPTDDTYDFLRAWGWDVITNTGTPPNSNGTGFEICDVTTAPPNVPAECKAGVLGSVAGQLNQGGQFSGIAGGIAVDPATGNVSIVDRENKRIQQFSATGEFERAWGADVELPAGGVELEICENASECKAGATGTGAGGTFSFNTAALSGIAADEDGNLYVADNARVQKFGPDGSFIAAAGWDVVDGVNHSGAPGDDTTVPINEYEICTQATTCKLGVAAASPGLGQYGTGGLPTFIAADEDGDVYTVGKTNGTIYGLTSGLAFDQEFPETTGTGTNPNRNAMTVDWDTGNLLFAQAGVAVGRSTSSVFELDPDTGSIVETHDGGNPEWVGLAIDSDMDYILGSRGTAATSIRALGEGPPTATIAAVTGNTGTKAKLNGTVNPNGLDVDECFFEWGTSAASLTNVAQCVPSADDLGNGVTPENVEADISGLLPNGATYHYRLKASNAKGPGQTSTQSFTTPTIVTTSAASAVTADAATLNGSVNPDGTPIIDCVFEYGTTTAYGRSAPCNPPAGSLTGASPVAVHADLDLHPGTSYDFRLKVTYGDGIDAVTGANQNLQTIGPRIVAAWSENVAMAEAYLKAEIDPEGVATTYRFEYGAQGPCAANPCATVPSPNGPVGSDSSPHKLSRLLQGLEPGTIYHYRVIATDANDVVNEGPDLSFATYSAQSLDTDCANQALRTGTSAYLSDCRAYELVSPIDKNGGDIETAEQEVGLGSHFSSSYRQASIEGRMISFSSATAFGDAIGGHWSNQYIARRGNSGWATHAINSRRGRTLFEPAFAFAHIARWHTYGFFQGFTADLSSAWVRDDNVQPLTTGALSGFVNLYRRQNESGTYTPLTNQGPFGPNVIRPLSRDGFSNFLGLRFAGASDDLKHQVFVAAAPLTSDAVPVSGSEQATSQIYDLADGQLHLVSVLPDGSPAVGNSFVGAANAARYVETRQQLLKNAVSSDGKRIVWTSTVSSVPSGPGAIYVRQNPGAEQSASGECDEQGKACTLYVAGESCVGSCDKAQFWAASDDGSHVLYSRGDSPNRTLYLFNVEAPESPAEKIAEGVRGVLATSEDLSHIYHISTKDLDAEGPAQTGNRNLYVYRDGVNVLVASLSSDDVSAVAELFAGSTIESATLGSTEPIFNQSRSTPDGAYFTFMSNSESLSTTTADYDNADVLTAKPDFQVYRYDADADKLSCVSCKPSGARPKGHLLRAPYSPLDYEFKSTPNRRVAASIPTHEHDNYASRVLSDDGQRLYFHSDDALLPRDTNGVQDVYQWEAVGTGSCDLDDREYAARNDGCISLISTGRDQAKSEFVDATPSGDEVYISVDESLDPRDPGLRDIYVAKVGGGFALESQSAPCEGEACQTPPPPPEFSSPPSSTFEGAGNEIAVRPAPPCKRGQVRRGGRCVSKEKLAKRACAKRTGKAKQRCVQRQLRRLNSTGRAGR